MITIGRDRTKKSQKRDISYSWGQASRKAIAITFDTGVDVHEIVAWAETDLENLRGVNFTGEGRNLGFSIDCLWALTQCSATALLLFII